MMLDREKKVHRPERLKGYDYSSPGCYFVTFNNKARGEDILCKVVEGSKEAETFLVGPDPWSGHSSRDLWPSPKSRKAGRPSGRPAFLYGIEKGEGKWWGQQAFSAC